MFVQVNVGGTLSDSEKLAMLQRFLAAGNMILIGGLFFWSPITVTEEAKDRLREAMGPAWRDANDIVQHVD